MNAVAEVVGNHLRDGTAMWEDGMDPREDSHQCPPHGAQRT